MNPGDPLPRVLYIDLEKKRSWVEERKDLFEKYLGGAGVAIHLLEEECPKGVDPLDPQNPIVFAVGPLVGLFPYASKTVAMFKSPLTGNLGESHAGGRSATSIRLAGYGAIVIRGGSERPVYVAIHGDKVFFRDASALWGMRSAYAVGRVIREREPGAGVRAIIRIGRAGEKLVRYACAITETYRHFGRLGLGAVFGCKKLKAIVVSGKRSLPVSNPKKYREVYDEIFELGVRSELMKKYHDLGTAANVLPLNEMKALPTRNLSSSSFEKAEPLSGEELARNFLGRRVACTHCPTGCIHLAALREPYPDEPYFYKTVMITYDYEPIYALGTILGMEDARGFLKLMDIVEDIGIDAMSTGVVLAWVTEDLQRGLITLEDTAGIELRWGDYESYIKAVEAIVSQPNHFFEALAKGVDYASSHYGGEEFALAFGGNEMPGYHTGPACYIGYLTGARHSHLDSAGYSFDEKTKEFSPEEAGRALAREESWRQILSSLVVCFFARGVYRPALVSKALNAAGFELSEEELQKLGVEILRKKHAFKRREGYDPAKLRIPKRITEVEAPHGVITEEFVRKGVEAYFEELGLDV